MLDRIPVTPEPWNQSDPGLKSRSTPEKIRIVNDTVNAYPYIEDRQGWGREDYWQTPDEFYSRNGGDCEDYAIAKYVWLRDLGIPEERLRLMVVYDTLRGAPHTVLAVTSGRDSLILDNQEKNILDVNSVPHYQPLFSINRDSWWVKKTAKDNFMQISALHG